MAVALWEQGRSVREAAAYLRLPVPEVRAARQRIVCLLVEAVGGHTHSPGKAEEGNHED